MRSTPEQPAHTQKHHVASGAPGRGAPTLRGPRDVERERGKEKERKRGARMRGREEEEGGR